VGIISGTIWEINGNQAILSQMGQIHQEESLRNLGLVHKIWLVGNQVIYQRRIDFIYPEKMRKKTGIENGRLGAESLCTSHEQN